MASPTKDFTKVLPGVFDPPPDMAILSYEPVSLLTTQVHLLRLPQFQMPTPVFSDMCPNIPMPVMNGDLPTSNLLLTTFPPVYKSSDEGGSSVTPRIFPPIFLQHLSGA